MAETTKNKPTAKKSKAPKVNEKQALGPLWLEALDLEKALEEKLLEEAILSAKMALAELEEETRKAPFERRSGLRLREKARKTERAFNRLRSLRKGDLIPTSEADD